MKIFSRAATLQAVNEVKSKPRLAGNQIPFGGTRLGFVIVGVYNRGEPPTTWKQWQPV